ncbi:MAG: carbohydrate ABC transporter permease, partial [Deltaproteobacteria bacterium]|nr:carbohydrate ABC transporter permease [Deltaproteobacteria bacterium]
MLNRPLSLWQVPVLLAFLAFALFPIFWLVMTAIKPPIDWNASPAIWVPSDPTLINFRTLFDTEAILAYGVGGVSQAATKAVIGSIIASVSATFLAVAIGLISAIGLSRYSRSNWATPLVILSGRMFPPAAIAVPFVIFFSLTSLMDTYTGLVAIYTAVTLPFSTWMLKSFIDDLPREM